MTGKEAYNLKEGDKLWVVIRSLPLADSNYNIRKPLGVFPTTVTEIVHKSEEKNGYYTISGHIDPTSFKHLIWNGNWEDTPKGKKSQEYCDSFMTTSFTGGYNPVFPVTNGDKFVENYFFNENDANDYFNEKLEAWKKLMQDCLPEIKADLKYYEAKFQAIKEAVELIIDTLKMNNKVFTKKAEDAIRTALQEHPDMVLRDDDALNKAQEKELSHLTWDSPWLKWELWNEEVITNGAPLKDNCYTHVYRRYPNLDRGDMKCFIGVNHIEGNKYFTIYLFISAETPYGPLESCEYEVWRGTDMDTGKNGEWTEFIGSELCDSVTLTKEDMNNRFVFHGPLECRICTGLLKEARN